MNIALLKRIAESTYLYELVGSSEIAEAKECETLGLVKIKQTNPSKGLGDYGARTSYAMLTPAGHRALAADLVSPRQAGLAT